MMMRAGVSISVIVVMIALDVGVEAQSPREESLHRTVAATRASTEEPDARIGESHLRSTADSAADERVRIDIG